MYAGDIIYHLEGTILIINWQVLSIYFFVFLQWIKSLYFITFFPCNRDLSYAIIQEISGISMKNWWKIFILWKSCQFLFCNQIPKMCMVWWHKYVHILHQGNFERIFNFIIYFLLKTPRPKDYNFRKNKLGATFYALPAKSSEDTAGNTRNYCILCGNYL